MITTQFVAAAAAAAYAAEVIVIIVAGVLFFKFFVSLHTRSERVQSPMRELATLLSVEWVSKSSQQQ